MAKNCDGINCPFVGNCKWYNCTLDRSGGCCVQEEFVVAAQAAVAQREAEMRTILRKFKLVCSFLDKRNHSGVATSYYFSSIASARLYMQKSVEYAEQTCGFIKNKTAFRESAPMVRSQDDENSICLSNGEISYKWRIQPEAANISRGVYQMYTSRVRTNMHKDVEGYHYLIEFNYDSDKRSAPAGEFLDAVAGIIKDKGDMNRLAVKKYPAAGEIGYCCVEYCPILGLDPVKSLRETAGILARVLDVRVEDCLPKDGVYR